MGGAAWEGDEYKSFEPAALPCHTLPYHSTTGRGAGHDEFKSGHWSALCSTLTYFQHIAVPDLYVEMI